MQDTSIILAEYRDKAALSLRQFTSLLTDLGAKRDEVVSKTSQGLSRSVYVHESKGLQEGVDRSGRGCEVHSNC